MSRVDIVRSIFEEWSHGDFRTSSKLLDEHALLVIHDDFPDWGLYLGVEQIGGYMRGLLEGFVDFTMTAERFVDAGDSVVVYVIQRGAGRTSGIVTENAYAQVLTFRGDSIIRIESIGDRAKALAMVGLGE
jgi:ketosteroid isomerase-like protein